VTISIALLYIGVNPRFWGITTSQILGWGLWGPQEGASWTGRETLLYLVCTCMYESSYFSREMETIAQNLAVNGNFVWINGNFGINYQKRSFGNFCLKNSKFFGNLPGKIESFRKFAWKNRKFLEICLEKSKVFGHFLEKKSNFFTRIHDPLDFKPDCSAVSL